MAELNAGYSEQLVGFLLLESIYLAYENNRVTLLLFLYVLCCDPSEDRPPDVIHSGIHFFSLR